MTTPIPLIGIERHRIATDGVGVTTLVAFHGCPLHCRYCLNPQCLQPDYFWRDVTVEDLLAEVAVDDLYFQATGGGITFGGGEPLLRSDFIADFCRRKPAAWHITLETSLNVPRHRLETVFPHIDQYFVDIKDTHPDIYRNYTARDNAPVMANLAWLAAQGAAEKVLIRLPHIPDYNTQADVDCSRRRLEALGFTHFDEFDYIKKQSALESGTAKCDGE